MSVPVFYTAKGRLTNYAFACGYVETQEGYRLSKDGVFQIQGRGIWTQANTIGEARKKLDTLASHLHNWQSVCGIDGETIVGAECEECELFLDRGDFI